MTDVVLAIEASNPSGGAGVAVARADDAITSEALSPGTRHGDDLMPAIARLCEREGVSPHDLTRVVVSLGPGGYTGVRIAITTAKLLAEAIGADLVGVPTADVVAASLEADRFPALICLASKGATTYATRFEAPSDAGLPLGLLDASDLAGSGLKSLVADRHLPAPLRERAASLELAIVEPTFDPAACLRLGRSHPATDPATLAPIYPREPEAVRKWRELHPD
ncbi:MAG: tRNA (adenosine(37)-N6)-threonylcarbamoyltransferase complex dimerization subunit type 1 TsaB [Phycisphaerales bacterium]